MGDLEDKKPCDPNKHDCWERYCPRCGEKLYKHDPPDYPVKCKCGWVWN